MSQSAIIYPRRFFFWKIVFEDGHQAAQFGPEGDELFVRDLAPQDCWKYDSEKGRILDMKRNVWTLLEKTHGRAISVSWMPFTEELKQKIEAKQKISIVVLPDRTPITKQVPSDCYPYWRKQTEIRYSTGLTQNGISNPEGYEAFEAVLEIGYLPRQGTDAKPLIDTIILRPKEAS